MGAEQSTEMGTRHDTRYSTPKALPKATARSVFNEYNADRIIAQLQKNSFGTAPNKKQVTTCLNAEWKSLSSDALYKLRVIASEINTQNGYSTVVPRKQGARHVSDSDSETCSSYSSDSDSDSETGSYSYSNDSDADSSS